MPRVDGGDIADPAEIMNADMLVGPSKHLAMEERGERGALAAGGDISSTKI